MRFRGGYDCCTSVGQSIAQFFFGKTLTTDFKELFAGDAQGFYRTLDAFTHKHENLLGLTMFVSDRRLKKNIVRIGDDYAGPGVHLYVYDWRPEAKEVYGLEGLSMGPLAQEVQMKYPDQVFTTSQGHLAIRLDRKLAETDTSYRRAMGTLMLSRLLLHGHNSDRPKVRARALSRANETVTQCSPPGCGDHGECTAKGVCKCTGFWSGKNCNTPPPVSTVCKPSDDAFRSVHGGDADCGNYGHYGTCEATGKCDCGLAAGAWKGNRCELECSNDADCGAPQAGTCDPHSRQCVCKDGWSGNQCRVPPPGPCKQDADCAGWAVGIGQPAQGACDRSTGQCTCASCPLGTEGHGCTESLYAGSRCQIIKPVDGAACDTDSQCPSGDVCTDQVCTSKNPTPSPNLIEKLIDGVVESLSTPEGIESLALMMGVQKGVHAATEWLVKGGVKAIVRKVIEKRVASGMASKAGTESAEDIGGDLVAKMMARSVGEDAVKGVASAGADATAEIAADAAFGPFGLVLGGIRSVANCWHDPRRGGPRGAK